MNLRRRASADEAEISLTSLIDVLFLLLIFFMVSTTFERQTQLAVNLPEASGEAMQAEGKILEITIDADGRYYVNREELVNAHLDTLKRAMRAAVGDEGQPRVILSADRKAPHEAVVKAMDAAGQLGFVQITIATSKADGSQP